MAAKLRMPFLIRTLSHSPRSLQITWKDGVQSTFPNAWLRSNVRDDRFFDKSNTYRYGHISFVKQNVSISSARQQDDETIKVMWQDHTSDFDVSWLRAQDVASAPMSKDKVEWERWDSSLIIPEYSYHTRENELTLWTKDLKKYGLIMVNDVPRNEKGFLDVMHMIGPLRRRYHPTDILRLEAWNSKYKEVDPTAYGTDHFNAHIDHTYLESPAKILGFLCTDYNAPLKDTVSYFSNSIRVAEDLQKSDPEAFQILSTTPFRRARRRIGVEEDCDPKDERIYDWDTYYDSPVIVVSNNEIKIVRSSPVQNCGHILGSFGDDYIRKFYSAYDKFVEMLENPKYHAKKLLKPGSMFLFDNHRLVHGRSQIYPNTSRVFLIGFIAEETWNSRWRNILGKQSGIADKWLFGCSNKSLEILGQRME